MLFGNKLVIGIVIALVLIHYSHKSGDDPGHILPDSGIVAVIVEETSQRTPAISNVIESTTVTSYLNEKCTKDDKGKPEWQVWDQHQEVIDAPQPIKDAFAIGKTKPLPSLVVSNGRTGYAGALPKDVPTMMQTLAKYGGKP